MVFPSLVDSSVNFFPPPLPSPLSPSTLFGDW